MYHKINEFNEALKCFTKVLTLRPKDTQVYISRGKVYQDMANHLFAINDFNMAAELDKTNPIPFIYRGISKLKLCEYQESIADFQM